MLISCTVTVQLICVFVFAYAKSRFSHGAAQNAIVIRNISANCSFHGITRFPEFEVIRASLIYSRPYFQMLIIMVTRPCNVDPLTHHLYIVKVGFTGLYLIFLFLSLKNIDCGYSLDMVLTCTHILCFEQK